MVNRILYLHGAGDDDGPDDEIARELRAHWPDAEVVAPQLPPTDQPESAQLWQHEIARAIRELPDEPWILVGHSLGGSEALRYLCRTRPRMLRRTVIVSTPLWEAPGPGHGTDESHPWWGPQWALPIHADRALADLDVVIVHSEDDPVVPVAHAHRLDRMLACSRLQVAHRGGHCPVDWIRRAA